MGNFTTTVMIDDQDGGSSSVSYDVNVVNDTFQVIDFSENVSGFDVQFNRSPVLDDLNLYDGMDAEIDLPDLSLVGDTTGLIRGSMVWEPSSNTLSFVKTGGPLVDDHYTVTLRSDSDAFHDNSSILDGDNDFIPGTDYIASFTVENSNHRVVLINDFARGAGQAVDISPANQIDSPFPIVISNADHLTTIEMEITYDVDLLSISNILKSPTLPSDWTLTTDLTTPGVAMVEAAGATSLFGVNLELFTLQASVPDQASYGAAQVIRIENLVINNGNISSAAILQFTRQSILEMPLVLAAYFLIHNILHKMPR